MSKEQFDHYNRRPARDITALTTTFKGTRGVLGEALLSASAKTATALERAEKRRLKKEQKAAGDRAALESLARAREAGLKDAA